MTEPTTRAQLDGIVERIAQELPGRRFYMEHGTGYWTLYEEESHGAREVLHGQTKTELWDRCHAFLAGITWAREEVSQDA